MELFKKVKSKEEENKAFQTVPIAKEERKDNSLSMLTRSNSEKATRITEIRKERVDDITSEKGKRIEFPNFHEYHVLDLLRSSMKNVGSASSKDRIFSTGDEKEGAGFEKVVADHRARYEFASNYTKGKRTLDIACGVGTGTEVILNNASERTGVDNNRESIEYAKKTYSKTNFVNQDAIAYLAENKTGKFDTVVSLETISYMENPKEFLQKIYDNLNDGGTLVLSTPNKIFSDLFYGGTFNKSHKHEFYNYEMSNLIEQVFGVKPEMYALRPVEKAHMIVSGIRAFMRQKPQIVPLREDITGINSIFVVKKE